MKSIFFIAMVISLFLLVYGCYDDDPTADYPRYLNGEFIEYGDDVIHSEYGEGWLLNFDGRPYKGQKKFRFVTLDGRKGSVGWKHGELVKTLNPTYYCLSGTKAGRRKCYRHGRCGSARSKQEYWSRPLE